MDATSASPTPPASDKIDLERSVSTSPTPGKAEVQHHEAPVNTSTVQIMTDPISSFCVRPQNGAGSLSKEHREYLLASHGTLELDPMPDMNDADPYNWPKSMKMITIFLVAFHAMMIFFTPQPSNHPSNLPCSLITNGRWARI